VTPVLATEVSRAFVPPCTRGQGPGRQLSDQSPDGQSARRAGTL